MTVIAVLVGMNDAVAMHMGNAMVVAVAVTVITVLMGMNDAVAMGMGIAMVVAVGLNIALGSDEALGLGENIFSFVVDAVVVIVVVVVVAGTDGASSQIIKGEGLVAIVVF